jgi:hypothetical protein
MESDKIKDHYTYLLMVIIIKEIKIKMIMDSILIIKGNINIKEIGSMENHMELENSIPKWEAIKDIS